MEVSSVHTNKSFHNQLAMTKTKAFIYCFCAILHYCIGDDLEVKTSQGALKGAYFKAIDGKKYTAFMSIPYAQPPIGPLRFKAPIEAGTWEGVRDASQDSGACVHNHPFFRGTEVFGDEDCLYLNVYTPSVSTRPLLQQLQCTEFQENSLLPVMVIYHGGGWMMGTTNKFLYGPDFLMERDIVLVSVNFRLGALGLLSTTDEAAPGNWLFKDQNMALRWVKKHIIHFGGDPNLVTIFGESAHHHMVSPMSQGLFHRAIFHSGNALSFWGISETGRAQKQAKKLGKIMDCPTDDNVKMIECLRTKDAKEIMGADTLLYDWDVDPIIPFRPVVEPPNENSFLSEDPRVLFKEGRFAQVPTMHGLNENEGCLRSGAIYTIPGYMEEFAEKFDVLAPPSFGYELAKDPAVITAAIKDFYLNGNTININTIMNLTDIYTDSYFTTGLDETLVLSLPKTSEPVYLYFFTFKGRLSFSVPFGDPVRDYGTCHGDELIYLFNIGGFPALEGREKDVSDAFVTIWTNFAKTGDPSSPIGETKLGNIPSWPHLDASDLWKHVKISDNRFMEVSSVHTIKSFHNQLAMTKTKAFIYCFCAILHYCIGDAPEVKTSQGALKGAYFNTINGRKYAAFMSLPYAQPPIGPLRFKAPIEAGAWEGVRDASIDSPICVQTNPFFRSNDVAGVEDCLYLNVYTPAEFKESSLLPVMVFIHGGGWISGSGKKLYYGSDYLMDRDIVLVSVNYRLGAFGLLSTMDEAAPGNWLFKDQNMALRWIQKHIVHFGGDPNLVTIFGESAGAASVHYHMLSPMSQGLFHRAILHSGNALCSWAISPPGHPQKQAKKLGKIMGCPIDDSLKMVECLRTKKADEIAAADRLFYEWDFDPIVPYKVVVEPPNENEFLSEDPRVLLKEGRFAQVPTMHGLNENEGAIRTAGIFGKSELMEEFAEKFDSLAPASFGYQDSKDPAVITAAIKEFYLNGITINSDTYLNITDIYSDSSFTSGLDESLKLSMPKTSNSVYMYFFSFKGRHSYSQFFGDPTRNYGACHGDELIYLFSGGLFPELEGQEKDVSDSLLSIWTNFARTGLLKSSRYVKNPLIFVIYFEHKVQITKYNYVIASVIQLFKLSIFVSIKGNANVSLRLLLRVGANKCACVVSMACPFRARERANSHDPSSPVRETKLGNIPSWPKLDTSDKWKHVKISDNESDSCMMRRRYESRHPTSQPHSSPSPLRCQTHSEMAPTLERARRKGVLQEHVLNGKPGRIMS
ncbi:uncharacterized protein LOC143910401 [Arctopsyche grandis]|uniref:uncharacterized protein LOC143910401 n=1 Tax=Arctopsyche grandis TaxID=121162 RepID=UPI00406D6F12